MEHQFRHEEQERGDHVGHVLGHLIVAGVQGVHQLAGGAVAGHEVVGAHGITLETDAEELRLQAGLHPREVLLEDLVQGLGEDLAVALALHGLVLGTVVDPDVHDAGVALGLAHRVRDAAAALGVLDPEFADGGIGIGEGQVAALGMAEGGGVEVQLHVVLLGPLDPALEVIDGDLVAVHELAAEVAVDLVEVQAVVARDEALREFDVGPDLVDVAGAARIVAGGLDAAGEACGALETDHVVGLPAVQGDGGFLEGFDGLVGVDADGGIALLGELVGFQDLCFFHGISVFNCLA